MHTVRLASSTKQPGQTDSMIWFLVTRRPWFRTRKTRSSKAFGAIGTEWSSRCRECSAGSRRKGPISYICLVFKLIQRYGPSLEITCIFLGDFYEPPKDLQHRNKATYIRRGPCTPRTMTDSRTVR